MFGCSGEILVFYNVIRVDLSYQSVKWTIATVDISALPIKVNCK